VYANLLLQPACVNSVYDGSGCSGGGGGGGVTTVTTIITTATTTAAAADAAASAADDDAAAARPLIFTFNLISEFRAETTFLLSQEIILSKVWKIWLNQDSGDVKKQKLHREEEKRGVKFWNGSCLSVM